MTSTLQVEATVVVDGLGRGESEVTPTFLALGEVGAGYRLGRNEKFMFQPVKFE